MSRGREPFAAQWRQSREQEPFCAGRYSAHRFVSGKLGCSALYAREAQIATAHVRLGAPQQVPDLGAQFAIGVPASRGFEPEQDLGNLAVRRTGLRAIERLQGAKMQQRGPGDRPRGFLRERTPLKKLCLRIEGINWRRRPAPSGTVQA